MLDAAYLYPATTSAVCLPRGVLCYCPRHHRAGSPQRLNPQWLLPVPSQCRPGSCLAVCRPFNGPALPCALLVCPSPSSPTHPQCTGGRGGTGVLLWPRLRSQCRLGSEPPRPFVCPSVAVSAGVFGAAVFPRAFPSSSSRFGLAVSQPPPRAVPRWLAGSR